MCCESLNKYSKFLDIYGSFEAAHVVKGKGPNIPIFRNWAKAKVCY